MSVAVSAEIDLEADASNDVSPRQTTSRPGGALPGAGKAAGPSVGDGPELPLGIERLLQEDETVLFAERPTVSVARVRGLLKLVAVGAPLSL
ncbi:MAG: hypothetical protein VX311_02295, partial [Planctomycetota bacterium]|nr:hypothetical protein [Planctomycetota bacterium]